MEEKQKYEKWRSIPDYEGIYEVSSWGRVRSLDRIYSRIIYGKTIMQSSKGRMLKQITNIGGYLYVNLCKADGRKRVFVHRLVASAFIHNADNLPIINHKDRNPQNNRVENLEWCSYRYNTIYKDAHILGKVKLRKAVEQLTLNGEHVASFVSAREAERKTGFHQSRISGCCRGETLTAYGYKWRYSNG